MTETFSATNCLMRLARSLLLIPLLFSCSENGEDLPDVGSLDATIKFCFVGDRNAEPIIEPVILDENEQIQPLTNNMNVPLVEPPQGGMVMFVSVRARNLDGCPAQISTSLKDICTGEIVAFDDRPIELKPMGDVLVPLPPADYNIGIADFSNITSCPNRRLGRDMFGHPYRLSIFVTDKESRTASTAITINPFCAAGLRGKQEECLCTCDQEYTGTCSMTAQPDSGVPAGTCRGDAGM